MTKCAAPWGAIAKNLGGAALRGVLPGAAIGAGAGAIHGATTPGGSAFGGAMRGALGGAALGATGVAALRGARIASPMLARSAKGAGYTNLAGLLSTTKGKLVGAERALGLGGNKLPGWASGMKNWAQGTAAPAVQGGLQNAANKVGQVAKQASYDSESLAQLVLDRAIRG